MRKGHRGSSGRSERNRLDSVRFLFVFGCFAEDGTLCAICTGKCSDTELQLLPPSAPLHTRVTSSGFDFVSVDYDLFLTTIPGPVPQSQMQTLTSDRALSV